MNDPEASPTTVCQVLVENAPQTGTWNMALDEALLESGANEGQCWLRWYRWSHPTVSLGYFQDREIPDDLRSLPVVKRLSGGGAILHHHEWTYSVVVPSRHPRARNPPALYGAVHDRIISVLAELGVMSQMRGSTAAFRDDSFLCFQRGDANDVLIGQYKVLGSAQRRRRGAVLQHGSLLMASSPHAGDLPGLHDLGLEQSQGKGLVQKLAISVAELFGEAQYLDSAPKKIMEVAAKLQQNRYKTDGSFAQ